MRKILIIVALCLFMNTAVQATLIQGNFSGLVEIKDGYKNAIADDASFAGDFLYDDETMYLWDFSVALDGIEDTYVYTYTDGYYNSPIIGQTAAYGGVSILDFDGLGGNEDFITGETFRGCDLFLQFDGNEDFIPGTSGWGSVLYLWTTNRYYCNITSMTMTPHSPIPEPATMLLFGSGIVVLFLPKRRRKK